MVTTEIGKFVPGTTARLVVSPVATLVRRKAKASENSHWKFPYSSEAKIKSKLNCVEIEVKSNSRTVAFVEFMLIPAAASVASKSASPVQAVDPSSNRVVLGPTAFRASPVLSITPAVIGKFGLVLVK